MIIKLRAWHSLDKKMYHFDKPWWCNEYQSFALEMREKQVGDYCFDFDEDGLSEPMLFTGVMDKNGKEIYEKDIVRKGDYLGIIQWYAFQPSFVIQEIGSINFIDLMSSSIPDFLPEIIGNTYQNPELCK